LNCFYEDLQAVNTIGPAQMNMPGAGIAGSV